MNSGTQAHAETRGLLSAILLGSGIGLGLGALYLAAGITDHAADYARGRDTAKAVSRGFAQERVELAAPAATMRFGGMTFDGNRVASKTKRRADLECLAEAVYYEARGESPRGQFAVAQVVMNRVKHPAFPKSVCAVVFQGAGRRGCQFSFACDGSMRGRREAEAWSRARRVATRALAGAALADVGAATHFHTTGVSPLWAPQMLRVSQVGMHIFYRFSPRRLRTAPALPSVDQAVLISAPATAIGPGDLTPTVESAIDASLQSLSPPLAPAMDAKAKPVQPPVPPAPPQPAEAALLTTPQTASVAGS